MENLWKERELKNIIKVTGKEDDFSLDNKEQMERLILKNLNGNYEKSNNLNSNYEKKENNRIERQIINQILSQVKSKNIT